MIDRVLSFLAAELNAHLLAKKGSAAGGATLSRLVSDAGEVILGTDRLGLAVVAIDPNAMPVRSPPLRRGAIALDPPPLRLELTIIVAAHFTEYEAALRQLSEVIAFFHENPVLSRDRHPRLDAEVVVAVDQLALSLEELSHVWTIIGAKQLPSLFYRVRLQSKDQR
jgi:hypothetical protein